MCANPVFLVFLLSIYNSVSAHPVLVKKLLHLYNYIYIYITVYRLGCLGTCMAVAWCSHVCRQAIVEAGAIGIDYCAAIWHQLCIV